MTTSRNSRFMLRDAVTSPLGRKYGVATSFETNKVQNLSPRKKMFVLYFGIPEHSNNNKTYFIFYSDRGVLCGADIGGAPYGGHLCII